MARRKLTDEEKAEKAAKEQQELTESNLRYDLKRLRDGYYPTPTRMFNIGDRILWGSSENTNTVEEVIDGGMIYKFKSIGMKPKDRYSSESGPFISYHYRPWVDIFPYVAPEEMEKIERLAHPQDLRMQFMQSQVESLLHSYYSDYAGIDMNPDYQRGNVWDLEDKVALIDSIFNNIDIGKFVLIKMPYGDKEKAFQILDGKQRLTALLEFYEDRFQYKGKYFSQLHWRDKSHFQDFSVSRAETRYEEMTNERKYRYFLNLNTTGKPQDPKHIEHVRNLLKTRRNNGYH